MRKIISCSIFLALCNLAICTIRTVPTDFSTIPSALSASSPHDTVLVLPGDYQVNTTLSNSITICSNWIFSGDTNEINSTRIGSDTGKIFYPTNDTISFQGLTFHAVGVPVRGRGVLYQNPNNPSWIKMDHCKVNGSFDTAGTTLISASRVNLRNFVFIDDSIGKNEFMYAPKLSILSSSFFFSGTDPFQENFYIPESLYCADSYFTSYRELFDVTGWTTITHCTFDNMGSWIFLASQNSTIPTQVISNCNFNHCVAQGQESLFLSESPNVHFNHCSFTNCLSRVGTTSIFYNGSENSMIYVSNCVFQDNSSSVICFASNALHIDSTRFINNSSPIISPEYSPNGTIQISYSDFIGNSQFVQGSQSPYTIFVPNCFWGDSTGPQHSLNPTGQGMPLPDYANPFPFRTSPVFPIDGVSEHSISYSLPNTIELLPAYPNPFNSTVTIRYSLPRAEPVVVTVWNELGQLVTTLNGPQPQSAGVHSLRWSPAVLATGKYYVRASSRSVASKVIAVTYLR